MRQFLGRVWFFVAMLGVLGTMPALADSPYTVAGIHVDATGTSPAGARNAAIAAGRVDAWQTLYRRLVRQSDWTRQPALTADQLQKYVTSYFPVGERRSTTRYVADVTYIFNPGTVVKLLQSAGIAYTTTTSHRVLVIPLDPAYSKASVWATALGAPRGTTMVPFSLPMGDALDMNRLAGLHFDTVRWSDIAPVAARRGASEAVLILAEPDGRKLKISLRRIGPSLTPVTGQAEAMLGAGASVAAYVPAADVAIKAMEDLWKNRSALDASQRGHLTVDVAATSPEQFNALQKNLSGLQNIFAVSVVALDVGAARLTLSYLGTVEQLREALAQTGYSLNREGDIWRLTVAEKGAS